MPGNVHARLMVGMLIDVVPICRPTWVLSQWRSVLPAMYHPIAARYSFGSQGLISLLFLTRSKSVVWSHACVPGVLALAAFLS